MEAKVMLLEVLLVEDGSSDVRLKQEAFGDANDSIHLNIASDGVEAMAFPGRQGAHVHARRPDLIVPVLNLPHLDGCEVLAHNRADDSLKSHPTVLLPTSDAEVDVVKGYQLQANCYPIKPARWGAFAGRVKSINDFRLSKAGSPQRRAIG
jgi:two-component system response regulator